MENIDVRQIVSHSGLTYKQIAEQMGITPEWLSRIMRKPLSQKDKLRIMNAIEMLGGNLDEKANNTIERAEQASKLSETHGEIVQTLKKLVHQMYALHMQIEAVLREVD